MFAFKVLALLAVATVAFAHPAIHARQESSCSSGSLHCCDSISSSGSDSHSQLLGTLPTNLQGTNSPLGVNCIPISTSGFGSAGTCSAQTACCGSTSNEGTAPIGVDCSPVNTGL